MAAAPSKDDAAKARIIKHLNADHQESLALYLRHYAGLSSSAAQAPTLTDITLSKMNFRTRDGNTHTIPLNPPMTSWGEARVRTVDMDKVSRTALDISTIRITEFELPHGVWQLSVIGLIMVASAVYFNLGLIVPGTFIYDTLLPWWPGGPKWFFWFVNKLPYTVFGIHFVEAICLDYFLLRRYNVQRGSGLWWKWIISSILEGGGATLRLDAMVKRKMAQEKQH